MRYHVDRFLCYFAVASALALGYQANRIRALDLERQEAADTETMEHGRAMFRLEMLKLQLQYQPGSHV